MNNEDPSQAFDPNQVTLQGVLDISNNLQALENLSRQMTLFYMENLDMNEEAPRRSKYLIHLIGGLRRKLLRPQELQTYKEQKLGDAEKDNNKTEEEQQIINALSAIQVGGKRKRKSTKKRKGKKRHTRKH